MTHLRWQKKEWCCRKFGWAFRKVNRYSSWENWVIFLCLSSSWGPLSTTTSPLSLLVLPFSSASKTFFMSKVSVRKKLCWQKIGVKPKIQVINSYYKYPHLIPLEALWLISYTLGSILRRIFPPPNILNLICNLTK